ncbi:hypothetical protein QY702_04515 [Xanthomonas campestris pv. plantaginis]|uniref:hypothetical protein n=1 Tax=Xanthomonas campestris TaxID=339 RepID=UPI002B22E2D7|nr:hypothetical protein [Xanthomonas campestris]MEA9605731.1 hypothetical protein [Xanthomonas campestris pv. plantaginis]
MEAERRIKVRRVIAAVVLLALGAAFGFGLIGVVGPTHLGRDAPAWVQAIMSVATLAGAVIIPRWLDKQKRADAADQYIIFAQHLIIKTEALKVEIGDRNGRESVSMWGHAAEWISVAEGAKELELSSLPHASYLGTWLQIREMATRISDYYSAHLSSTVAYFPEDEYMLSGYLFRLRTLYNELVEADLAVRGRRGYSKIQMED